MSTRGKAFTAQFTVWDNSSNAPKTGDAGNLTLRWVKDGSVTTLSAPSITELDSTNCPGQYKASVTDSEADCNAGTICGKSSTADCVIIPQTYTFEHHIQLADTFLLRDWTQVAGTIPARCIFNAFRFVRNKWEIITNVLHVKKEDDSTDAFAANLTTDANGRVTKFEPTS